MMICKLNKIYNTSNNNIIFSPIIIRNSLTKKIIKKTPTLKALTARKYANIF